MYSPHLFFIHSSVDRHLDCLHILTIVNNAAVNIGMHVSFQISAFVFLGYKPRSGDFPGGPVVKNPPSNEGDTGSILGQGTKLPHAAGQLSPCAATREPMHCSY